MATLINLVRFSWVISKPNAFASLRDTVRVYSSWRGSRKWLVSRASLKQTCCFRRTSKTKFTSLRLFASFKQSNSSKLFKFWTKCLPKSYLKPQNCSKTCERVTLTSERILLVCSSRLIIAEVRQIKCYRTMSKHCKITVIWSNCANFRKCQRKKYLNTCRREHQFR